MEVIKWNEAQRKFLKLPELKYDETSMPGFISIAVISEHHALYEKIKWISRTRYFIIRTLSSIF
jgi:hypothetical protein